MKKLEYALLTDINQEALTTVLNSPRIRKHLITHDLFTSDTIVEWINAKMEVNATTGCKVRAIVYEGKLAGWCGIQLENEKYEMAIILDDRFWGLGKPVFKEMMHWAKAMGHKEVYINFLHTRPRYKFLDKLAISITEETLLGDTFLCYQLKVK